MIKKEDKVLILKRYVLSNGVILREGMEGVVLDIRSSNKVPMAVVHFKGRIKPAVVPFESLTVK